MKLVFLSFAFFLNVGLISAQNISGSDAHTTHITISTSQDFVEEYVNNPSGSKIVPNEFSNIDGSPFVTNDWLLAKIIIDSNKVYEKILIRLNVYDNKIHFRDTEGKERMLSANVKEVQITDANSTLNNAIFISGFAPNKNVFFKVLADGPKIRLLEKLSARKTDVKVFNGEPKIQFDVDKEVYFYSVSVKNMFKGTKKCAEILEVFGNDKKVTEFAYLNGLRCNKRDEALKLVQFYNSY
jgi:hypothetical protein